MTHCVREGLVRRDLEQVIVLKEVYSGLIPALRFDDEINVLAKTWISFDPQIHPQETA